MDKIDMSKEEHRQREERFNVHFTLLKNNIRSGRSRPQPISGISSFKVRLDRAKENLQRVAEEIFAEELENIVSMLCEKNEIDTQVKKKYYLLLALYSIVINPTNAPFNDAFAMKVEEGVDKAIKDCFEGRRTQSNKN